MKNIDAFWLLVDKTDDCWIWRGPLKDSGYGVFQGEYAHRISWKLAFGVIPSHLEVCHNCPGRDNPRCVNPLHLFLGPHSINLRHAAIKGQMQRGEKRPAAKLTDASVREIRARYKAGGITHQRLATEYGVAVSQIWGVVNLATWKHVT